MCKILTVVGMPNNPKKIANAWKLVQASLPYMTANDKDGVGYAAYSRSTGLFAERWLNPRDAFLNRTTGNVSDVRLRKMLGSAGIGERNYNNEGIITMGDVSCITLHSRMATCAKGLVNTHPFISGDVSLIHNGVISNAKQLTNITSTCDSECILNEYTLQNVDGDPERIQDVADVLDGYYACAVINAAKKYLDIFRDESATLYATYSDKVGGMVVCTTQAILRSTFAALKWKVGEVVEVKPGQLIRICLETGTNLATQEFDTSGPATTYPISNIDMAEMSARYKDPHYWESGS